MEFYIRTELPIILDEDTGKLLISIELMKNCRSCAYSRKSLSQLCKTSWQCNQVMLKGSTSNYYVTPEKRINCKYYQKEKLNEKIYK